jgi:hypothetical protein
MRWTLRRTGRDQVFMGWMAGLARHHDHSAPLGALFPSFPETVICDQCNAADGRAKRMLGLPADWSFAPDDIYHFITASPHGPHRLDLKKARAMYDDNHDSRPFP